LAATITIDSDDKKGGELYEFIARRSVEDLALGGSVQNVHILIKTSIPLFIMKIKYREAVGKNMLGELSTITEGENGSKVTLESEIDQGDALKTLWSTFGRDKVEQAGRMDILVSGVKPKELEDIKIRDKAVDVSVKINELAVRVIPEGLRIRNIKKEEGCMTFVAAEDPIKEEWKELASGLEVGD
jgi:putative methanogenesis marker protein 17